MRDVKEFLTQLVEFVYFIVEPSMKEKQSIEFTEQYFMGRDICIHLFYSMPGSGEHENQYSKCVNTQEVLQR